MREDIQKLPTRLLLSKYKRAIRNAPSVFSAKDEEMDKYYNKLLVIEEEIIRRIDESRIYN